jgi:y4mF family transcriptional regulator
MLSVRKYPDREILYMTPAQIGSLIKETRKSQGLTQTQLAAASGVGLRFLVELEKGKGSSQLGKALTVLETLGCKISIAAPESAQP